VIHHAKVGILEYFTIAGILYQGFINIMEIIFDINDFHIKSSSLITRPVFIQFPENLTYMYTFYTFSSILCSTLFYSDNMTILYI